MTKPKWTPGPWCFTNGELPRVIVGVSGSPNPSLRARIRRSVPTCVTVCGVHRVGKFTDMQTAEAVVMANGHLIAAAPELYEALAGLVALCPPYREEWLTDAAFAECEEAHAKALAALAKARGEP